MNRSGLRQNELNDADVHADVTGPAPLGGAQTALLADFLLSHDETGVFQSRRFRVSSLSLIPSMFLSKA
ncbi:hypothetical protein MES5069_460010 [Mesorhizobium escarrei]|uniref:Uncharacterized protein n=1 Tax=Mesorhizobium escarrei TaxID=666018 RepID=A0ABN8K4M1_9HYPH|nr:hypothetical protein MES5069_460010 [Mesorhizobium escarrei]